MTPSKTEPNVPDGDTEETKTERERTLKSLAQGASPAFTDPKTGKPIVPKRDQFGRLVLPLVAEDGADSKDSSEHPNSEARQAEDAEIEAEAQRQAQPGWRPSGPMSTTARERMWHIEAERQAREWEKAKDELLHGDPTIDRRTYGRSPIQDVVDLPTTANLEEDSNAGTGSSSMDEYYAE